MFYLPTKIDFIVGCRYKGPKVTKIPRYFTFMKTPSYYAYILNYNMEVYLLSAKKNISFYSQGYGYGVM